MSYYQVGRDNWQRVNRFFRSVNLWDSDAEAVATVDPALYDVYSYHPNQWPIVPQEAAGRDIETWEDDRKLTRTERKPLSAEKYAAAWGLVPLSTRPYRDAGLWNIEQPARRAKEGRLGAYILYRNRYLVEPQAILNDVKVLKAEQSARRADYLERIEIPSAYRESPIVHRVIHRPVFPEPSIKMRCSDCDISWVTAGGYKDFCPQCYRGNVEEVEGE